MTFRSVYFDFFYFTNFGFYLLLFLIQFAYSTDVSPDGDNTPESQKSGDRLKSILGNVQTYRLVIYLHFQFIFLFVIFFSFIFLIIGGRFGFKRNFIIFFFHVWNLLTRKYYHPLLRSYIFFLPRLVYHS